MRNLVKEQRLGRNGIENLCIKPTFNYCTGEEQFTFFKLPKCLIDDAWSDLANFIGEMVAKYADAMELDQLPNPDCYLRMKRIKQLYKELYKTENIEKFRSIIIPIERNAAA